MKNSSIAVLVLLVILLLAGWGRLVFAALQPSTGLAPDFSSPTTDNQTFVMQEHRGKVVVLDFFALYCADCKIIERNLQAASRDWDPANVTVASVGVAPFETMDQLRAYGRQHNITWPIVRDEDQIAQRYAVYELGRVVVVDGEGRVVFAKSGSWQLGVVGLRLAVASALEQGQTPVRLAQYSVWGLAIVSAVAAFFSPCAVGLLPGYVAQTIRVQPDRGRPWAFAAKAGLLASLGLLAVFLGIGGLAMLAGATIGRWIPWFGPLIGLVLILAGVLLLVRPYSLWLQRFFGPLTAFASARDRTGLRGHLAYGVAYGCGAAGCTAPVLLSLVATAAAFGPSTALLVILVYAATAAALMVAMTLVVSAGREGAARWLQANGRRIEALSAVLFIAGGAFLLWYGWRVGTLAF